MGRRLPVIVGEPQNIFLGKEKLGGLIQVACLEINKGNGKRQVHCICPSKVLGLHRAAQATRPKV